MSSLVLLFFTAYALSLERTHKAKASFFFFNKFKLLQVTFSYLLEGLCEPSEICRLKKKKRISNGFAFQDSPTSKTPRPLTVLEFLSSRRCTCSTLA